ncbi:VWA containing CoxE family protein [Mycolicibacterium aromaticivorans JS19b1 = JCM 16368]|uniref:VWA containing CoxE family protein n=1 Tax=Mycolicibacterium aromaticivorans JS19b1 = JCM 16368 TaxID=1440774 RepID=A0A064CL44_9MYCO|nr:VWA domain-containing protein [Mycolicibacterium aromaticivorans]KDF00372.1 VWA containing CoxE family protein [Mycolicibacterium aromaticivorans JS19b1 = JCM 16368]
MTTPALLRGVDLAAFAAALVARLRAGGVTVAASGPAAFVAAMRELVPTSRTQLYWAARLTLVNRVEDLPPFDAVFEAVFADAVLPVDPVSLRAQRGATATPVPAAGHRDDTGPHAEGLPWATRPPSLRGAEPVGDAAPIPDVLPSRIVARAEEPFETFDEADLRAIGTWLERALTAWPTRRTLRTESSRHGKRIDLRATMRACRSTGWEPVVLARTRPRRRRRRLVLVCDVSRSMQPYAAIYLHLMRAAALRQAGFHPEVFAFSTTLTRLTAVLAHRAPEVALAKANAKVTDRYGGTQLGRSIADLLAPPHGAALRGAVVMIASDGWGADAPEVVDQALARLKRRAAQLIWLNPRAAAPGFQPLAGSMAAALPYCDVFLPANSLAGIEELFAALAAVENRSGFTGRLCPAVRRP